MRKTQYCCLEMLLLRNKVEKCDFLRFFLSQATAGKAIGSGLRVRPLIIRYEYLNRPLPVRRSAVAYGETQFSELKNSF